MPQAAAQAAAAASPPLSAMLTPEQLMSLQMLSAQSQLDADNGSEMESDEEEPAPEALTRYMAMRRHTIGVGDSEHEAPQDVRVKLAQHKPLLGKQCHQPAGQFIRWWGLFKLDTAHTNVRPKTKTKSKLE